MSTARHEPPMRRASPSASRVVLFGSSSYDHLLPIPAVENSLGSVRDLLVDPARGGLAPQCVLVRHDPRSAEDLHTDISREAGEAKDLFLVYFSGHGRIGRDNELYFTLASTSGDRDLLPYGALSLTTVRQILSQCQATAKVLVLDCCFAGRAVGDMTAQADAVTAQLDISGTYVLTATQGNFRTADAPPGARHTAFSEAFTEVLRTGIPGGPSLLSMDEIFTAVDGRLQAAGHPRPDKRNSRLVTRLGLVANGATETDVTAPADNAARAGTPLADDELLHAINGAASLSSYVDGLQVNRLFSTIDRVQALVASAVARHGAESVEAADLTAFLIRFRAHTASRATDRSDRAAGLEEALVASRDHLTQRVNSQHSLYEICRARLLTADIAIERAAACPLGFFNTYAKAAPYLSEARDLVTRVLRAGEDFGRADELRLRAEFLTVRMGKFKGLTYTAHHRAMSKVHERQLELLGAHHPDTEDTRSYLREAENSRRAAEIYMARYQTSTHRWLH
ncbi:caspase family protein [Streptomyces sp. NPDC001809]